MAFITPPGTGSDSATSTAPLQALSSIVSGESTTLVLAIAAIVTTIAMGLVGAERKRRRGDRTTRSPRS